MDDLAKVISNLDDKAKQTLIEIALTMANNKQTGWTGGTLWTIHYSQGSVGDAVEETRRSLFRNTPTK